MFATLCGIKVFPGTQNTMGNSGLSKVAAPRIANVLDLSRSRFHLCIFVMSDPQRTWVEFTLPRESCGRVKMTISMPNGELTQIRSTGLQPQHRLDRGLVTFPRISCSSRHSLPSFGTREKLQRPKSPSRILGRTSLLHAYSLALEAG